MALTVRATFGDVRPVTVGQLPEIRRRVLTSAGFVLVAKVKQRFRILSQGGTVDGTTWPPLVLASVAQRRRLAQRGLLRASATAIGIRTGEILNSFAFSIGQDARSVRLFNASPHFNLFDHRRPVYPNRLPADWQDSVNRVAQKTIDKLTK